MKCDAEGFAAMYSTVYMDMYRFALCMMKSSHDAEDAVSEAVVKAYESIGTLLRSKGASRKLSVKFLFCSGSSTSSRAEAGSPR